MENYPMADYPTTTITQFPYTITWPNWTITWYPYAPYPCQCHLRCPVCGGVKQEPAEPLRESPCEED